MQLDTDLATQLVLVLNGFHLSHHFKCSTSFSELPALLFLCQTNVHPNCDKGTRTYSRSELSSYMDMFPHSLQHYKKISSSSHTIHWQPLLILRHVWLWGPAVLLPIYSVYSKWCTYTVLLYVKGKDSLIDYPYSPGWVKPIKIYFWSWLTSKGALVRKDHVVMATFLNTPNSSGLVRARWHQCKTHMPGSLSLCLSLSQVFEKPCEQIENLRGNLSCFKRMRKCEDIYRNVEHPFQNSVHYMRLHAQH